MPYQAAFSFVDRERLSVLDVGGGDGRYFHELRGLYGERFAPRYDVLEASQVVQACRDIGIAGVQHFDSVDQLKGRSYSHIVFGAMLQILPEPEVFFREVVEKVDSEYVFVTVFPEHDGAEDMLCIKRKTSRGQDVSHPYWVFSQSRWRKMFDELGRVIMATDMPRYRYKMGGTYYAQRGYLIRRREASIS